MPYLVGASPAAAPPMQTSAQAWTAYGRGEIDPEHYGVGPRVGVGGAWFIRDYVFIELAHRQCDELLLWDAWGALSGPDDEDADLALVDQVAAALLAADDGYAEAERELTEWYARDPRLHPGDRVRCISPSGVQGMVDLATRAAVPAC